MRLVARDYGTNQWIIRKLSFASTGAGSSFHFGRENNNSETGKQFESDESPSVPLKKIIGGDGSRIEKKSEEDHGTREQLSI